MLWWFYQLDAMAECSRLETGSLAPSYHERSRASISFYQNTGARWNKQCPLRLVSESYKCVWFKGTFLTKTVAGSVIHHVIHNWQTFRSLRSIRHLGLEEIVAKPFFALHRCEKKLLKRFSEINFKLKIRLFISQQ